ALVLAAAVQQITGRPLLVVTAHLDEADDTLDMLSFFRRETKGSAQAAVGRLFPAYEVLPGESNISHELAAQRLDLLAELSACTAADPNRDRQGAVNQSLVQNQTPVPNGPSPGSPSPPDFIVAPIQALMQPAPGQDLLQDQIFVLKPGHELRTAAGGGGTADGTTPSTDGRDVLVRWLTDHGYTRLDAVEDAGDFAVRGEIVDVWPPGDEKPIRIDFFGDQIETLATFDIETLGTTGSLERARLVALGDRSTWPIDQTTSFLRYLPPDTIIWLVEPLEIQEQARSYFDRLSDARGIYSPQAVLKLVQQWAWAEMYQFGGDGPDVLKLPCKSLQRFDTKPDEALKELAGLTSHQATKPPRNPKELQQELEKGLEKGLADATPARNVVVVCDSKSEITRLTDLLDVKFPGTSNKIKMAVGALGLGFEWDETEGGSEGLRVLGSEGLATSDPSGNSAFSIHHSALVIVGHHEIFHRYNTRRRLRSVQGARPIDSFLDLQEGDYVVHVNHGIAKYMGMNSITRDGRQSDFLTLNFAAGATLHVPVTQIHLVQKYVGGAHGRPVLSVLGGSRWGKQKEEVAEAVMEMAADLLEVQAAREHAPGISYPPDTVWQKEFENAFPYPPTEDQITSVVEIKDDMAKPRPMDRLLCGDVGYGKTEVAMRAAFKVCEYGKQVAVLVPTTILSEQHEQTFGQRMGDYPFVVESISRFKTASQIKKIIERTRMGQVDILIGTHRLISKDVQFADLGLVIIDEEQRFGVEHKERLKRLRMSVDVLTMTATPIPRTLHMSLLGIRDISNLATPPQDRRSVVTEVIPYDKMRIKQALQRELARNGQVYFLHNRVYNIQTVADDIRQMVPDARIVIGHGQMHEHELEEVMHKFVQHQADILVSTTIIESGLDIPNANTMIINQAENFGLSDLHQLRGRVGRWKHRAYCYLMLSPDKTISSTAAKRLKAMEEYSSLGAGFKIALRDLEIRGAGNILGAEQSGHISAVGYEMYCQLLEEAVKKIKNQPLERPKDVQVDIGISGVLPKSYVDSERQRMDLYRRLSRCHTLEALAALEKDITDAFGPLPKPVQTLFGLTEVRLLAEQWSVVSIISKEPDLVFTIEDLAKLGPLLGKGVPGGAGSVRVVDPKTVHLRLPKPYFEGETLLNILRHVLNPNRPAVAPELPALPVAKPTSPLGRGIMQRGRRP
ncbi:MAG: transcription-repair coupling factor, partial [Phycisphaerae bacterium]